MIIIKMNKSYKNDDDQINDELKTINVNGVNREFILYIPSTYDSINAVPLMLNFHGWTMSASDQMNVSDMRALAESEKFIIVYCIFKTN